MPGSRTAPTVNGTPTRKVLSVTIYDYTGKQRTDSYYIDADATDAEIEAIVVATQALENGTIWRVTVGFEYNSIGDSSNALEEVWESREDNAVLLAKAPTVEKGWDYFIPTPVNDLFIEGTREIDPENAELATLLAAILPVRANYSFVSARFTSRRDIGTKVNF